MTVTLKERAEASNVLTYRKVVNVEIYMGQDGSNAPATFAKIVAAGTGGELTFNLKRYWMEVREK